MTGFITRKIFSFLDARFDRVDILKVVPGEEEKGKQLYLARWFIENKPGLDLLGRITVRMLGDGNYLHCILRSDDDPDPHDHPWDFETRVLWNGYDDYSYRIIAWSTGMTSVILNDIDSLRLFSKRSRSAEHVHQVKKRNDSPTWTLVERGPYRREWGFWKRGQMGLDGVSITEMGGFVMWRDYLKIPEGNPYDKDGKVGQ